MLPVNQWDPGSIVRDPTLLRLSPKGAGPVEFYAGLVDGAPVMPVVSDRRRGNSGLVYLGQAAYERGAPPYREAVDGAAK